MPIYIASGDWTDQGARPIHMGQGVFGDAALTPQPDRVWRRRCRPTAGRPTRSSGGHHERIGAGE